MNHQQNCGMFLKFQTETKGHPREWNWRDDVRKNKANFYMQSEAHLTIKQVIHTFLTFGLIWILIIHLCVVKNWFNVRYILVTGYILNKWINVPGERGNWAWDRERMERASWWRGQSGVEDWGVNAHKVNVVVLGEEGSGHSEVHSRQKIQKVQSRE